MTQLLLEYDPKPPFNVGTPETAGPELTAIAKRMTQELLAEGVEIARGLRRSRASAA